MTVELPVPEPGPEAAVDWMAEHLSSLFDGPSRVSPIIRGGQRAADAALAGFDVGGYASQRNQVLPASDRGASGLSPYIRHHMIGLRDAWDHVAIGSGRDAAKFRDELLWQEFARHLHARLGNRMARSLRSDPETDQREEHDPFDADLACVGEMVDELRTDGWLVNQSRMWLASHWTVRHRQRWQDGEDEFFRHLIDGSRAANRLGWQWTTGAGSSKPYGFSRWQVEKRAPELCRRCSHQHNCPIAEFPDGPALIEVEQPSGLRRDDDLASTAGPSIVESTERPTIVWLTVESLGVDDPALAANPTLPVTFVFDRALLERLMLSPIRLGFWVETLAELAADRELDLFLGDAATVLDDHQIATTFTPAPGARRLRQRLGASIVELHPWPWLARPTAGSVRSFSAWRNNVTIGS